MLKYKISLFNVFWHLGGRENKGFMGGKPEQDIYFNNLSGGFSTPLSNFNMGDNINTTIIFRDDSNRTIEELVKCNYAMVIKYDTETNNEISRRYFFAKVYHDSGRQMKVELTLDDIQTNFIPNQYLDQPAIINRSHLNRWVEDGENVKFNFESESNLFNEETSSRSKRLIHREKVIFDYGSHELNKWLDDNVAYWVYTFIDSRATYKVVDLQTPSDLSLGDIEGKHFKIKYNVGTSNEFGDIGVIYYPVYKTNKRIFLNVPGTQVNIELIQNAELKFRENNNNTSYYYTSKISPILNKSKNIQLNYSIDGNNNLILTTNSPTETIGRNYGNIDGLGSYIITDKVTDYEGCLISSFVSQNFIETEEITIPNVNFSFSKNEIKNSLRNKIFNPKLLNTNFLTLNISSSDGNTFEYDISKINSNKIKFAYSEPLTPGITKYYFRVKAPTGLYIEETNKNYTGLVGSVDNSIPLTNDQYSSFIANNKNFWLQSTGNNVLNTTFDILNGFKGGLINGTINAINSSKQAIQTQMNTYLTTDNMKNAPSQLRNAGGDIIFNNSVTDVGLYVEIYDSLDNEKEQFDDFTYFNGFSYFRSGFIGDHIYTRKIFNYIEAETPKINSILPLSDEEEERLKEIFRNGIIFIHNEEEYYLQYGNFGIENYERSLDG